MRTQHPFRGGWLHRLSPGHCYHAPAHVGRVYFMQEIVLNGQVLFHQLTGDPDVMECLKNAARGMLDEYAEQKAQGLPGWGYTSCPFMLWPGPRETSFDRVNPKHSFGALQHYMAPYYAGATSQDPDVVRKLRTLFPNAATMFNHPVPIQGKMFAQATRWVPNTMYYLTRLPELPRPKP